MGFSRAIQGKMGQKTRFFKNEPGMLFGISK
jgi:hypothetical protein